MGRPLEFDPALARCQALEVFWEKGFEATSLQDLLRAMGLSKSSFYQAFNSKRELFADCVEAYRNAELGAMTKALASFDSPWEFLEVTFRRVAKGAEEETGRRGCMLMHTAAEICRRDVGMAEMVEAGTQAMAAAFRSAVEGAQAEGKIPSEHDSEALGMYLVSSMCGLKTLARAGASPEHLESVVQGILRGLG